LIIIPFGGCSRRGFET